jgi:hypothetical protein
MGFCTINTIEKYVSMPFHFGTVQDVSTGSRTGMGAVLHPDVMAPPLPIRARHMTVDFNYSFLEGIFTKLAAETEGSKPGTSLGGRSTHGIRTVSSPSATGLFCLPLCQSPHGPRRNVFDTANLVLFPTTQPARVTWLQSPSCRVESRPLCALPSAAKPSAIVAGSPE